MKMSGGPASINIKIPLLITAIIIAIGTLIYTQRLVQNLQVTERQIVQLYANGIEYVANTSRPDADITFMFDNILRPIDFPIINTGPDNKISIINKADIKDIRNIRYDTSLSNEKLEVFFAQKIKEMDAIHKPIEVTYKDSLVRRLRPDCTIKVLPLSANINCGFIYYTRLYRLQQYKEKRAKQHLGRDGKRNSTPVRNANLQPDGLAGNA
jgi:hypothetical protein